MTLTRSNGPLAPGAPETVNYEIVGPQHKLLLTPFPRRLRAEIDGEVLLDTTSAKLLYESNIMPVAYIPMSDVRSDLLEPTEQSTHCPFKGDASYWTIRVGNRVVENAVWGYQDPHDDAPWLKDHVALYWDSVDAWFDEQDPVRGHLADPYHRFDIRLASSAVRVLIDGVVVAETTNAMVLSETGMPNRYYIPSDDVRTEMFERSQTTTHCPYKGDSEYWSLRSATPRTDVAWSYPSPFDAALRISGHWSFLGDDVTVELT